MNVFEAGVTLYLVDKVSGALGQVARSLTRTQTAATALQARLNTIHATFNSGLIMAGGGIALAMPLVAATKAAMDLQTALGRVQIATGASNAQMQQLNDTLTQTANATGIFSKPTLAQFAADMYASGIARMDQINALLPLFAKGADVMKILSHGKITPEEAAHTFSALAHQFGRYDPESMRPIVEAAAAIAPSLPGGLKTLKGMGSYVNILGNRTLGINPVELMTLEAAIAQTSGGTGTGRGGLSGANLIGALKRSMPGVFGAGLLKGKSAFSAEVIGLAQGGVSTVFKDNKLSLDKLIDVLSQFQSMSGTQLANRMLAHTSMLGKKAPEEEAFLRNFLNTPGAPKAQLITSLLTSQAGTASGILQLFGDEKFKGLLKSIQDRVKSHQNIEQMQAQAMKMLEPQLWRLQTNFTTLASTIGMHMIPVLTPIITKLGDLLNVLNEFAEKHPLIIQTAMSLLSLASAALLIGGAVQILRAGFMGLALFAGPVGMALSKITPMLSFLTAGIGASLAPALQFALRFIGPLGIAIGAVALVIANWDRIMQFVHQHQQFFIHIAAMAAKAVEVLTNALSNLLKWILSAVGGIGNFISSMPWLKQLGDNIRKTADNAMKVDDLTARRDANYLQSKGMGGLVDAIKGSAKGQTVLNDHSVINIDAKGMSAAEVQKLINDAEKNKTSRLLHAASANSGNSVGRSLNQGGATRP